MAVIAEAEQLKTLNEFLVLSQESENPVTRSVYRDIATNKLNRNAKRIEKLIQVANEVSKTIKTTEEKEQYRIWAEDLDKHLTEIYENSVPSLELLNRPFTI